MESRRYFYTEEAERREMEEIKKTRQRRLLTLLFMACIVISLLPMPVFADTEIYSVEITDVTLPVGGEAPNFNNTLPLGVPYYRATPDDLRALGWTNSEVQGLESMTGMRWEDANYAFLSSSSIFEANKAYHFSFVLIPGAGYTFGNSTTATINGGTALVQNIYYDNRGALVVYSQDVAAKAPAPVYYEIAVSPTTYGTITPDKTKATRDEKVTLTVAANTGYELDTLEVMQGTTAIAVDSDNSFTMPEGNVTVNASFKRTTFDITVSPTTNGTVTPDRTKAKKDEKVTLRVAADTGYELDTLEVMQGTTAIAVDSDNSFTMPEGNVVVTATFKSVPAAVEYKFTEGDGSVYIKESGKDLTFTTDGPMADCTGIKVDGTLIVPSNYTLASGSTIIRLNNAYLETLAIGDHTITAIYDTIMADARFKVVAAPQSKTIAEPTKVSRSAKKDISPKTGDNSNLFLWLTLLVASCSVAVATHPVRKREHMLK